MTELKTVSLSINDLNGMDYDFLFDDIKDEFVNIMEEKGISYSMLKDTKLYGDVSYSQGRGIGIDGLNFGVEEIEKMLGVKFYKGIYSINAVAKFNGDWRYKKVYMGIEREDKEKDFVARDKNGKKYTAEELEQYFCDEIKEIENKLLKYGEKCWEYREKEELCRQGLARFFEENNIEGGEELRDYNYTTEKENIKEGMTFIADSGDTSIDGLRVELGELTKHIREHKTIEDGKLINERQDTFYTFKN